MIAFNYYGQRNTTGTVFADLAAIRKLLEEGDGDETCPSCGMPFDKGKKRKLIDSCGHERCYACMFRNEGCQLCAAPTDEQDATNGKRILFKIPMAAPFERSIVSTESETTKT